MIGRQFSDTMDAMIFPGCNAVHTFFMTMPLDVLFLDREKRVVRVIQHLRPWHPGVRAGKASTTVEFPAGTLNGIKPGDRIVFQGKPDQK